MTKKIKILQIQLRFNVNISDLAEQIIQGLPKENFEITTAFLRDKPTADQKESRAQRSIYFNFKKKELKGLKRFNALFKLYQHCKKEQYDVIIAHRFKPMNMLMILNRLIKLPLCIGVQHGIGDYDRFARQIESRLLIKKNWKTIGVSSAVCKYLIGIKAGFTSKNTLQINNAIDINHAEKIQLTREHARDALKLNHDPFIFGCIGRLVPIKGHITLIESFAKLHTEFPNAQIAIIGEGRSRPDLELAINNHGLQSKVHLLGAKEDALQYVKAFNVFVMPSQTEGLPLALLEGMSGHLPVIGSNINSLRPILENCDAEIFTVDNIESLTETLRKMLNKTPEQLHLDGEKNYNYLRSAHNISEFRKQYRDLIESFQLTNSQ